MKKTTFKRKRPVEKTPRSPRKMEPSEKTIDSESLDQEVPEEFREALPNALPGDEMDTTNWSQAQDRSEDLADIKDPFIQQPERDTDVPSELTQHTGSDIVNRQEDLARLFETERQHRPER